MSSNLKVEIFWSGKALKQTIVLSEFLEFRFRLLGLQDTWIIYKKTCKGNLLISCLRVSMADFTVSVFYSKWYGLWSYICNDCTFLFSWKVVLRDLETPGKQCQALCTNAIVTECCFSGTEAVVSLAMDRLVVLFGTEILKIVPGRVSTEVDARFVMRCCDTVL